jgi:hypothetical protein
LAYFERKSNFSYKYVEYRSVERGESSYIVTESSGRSIEQSSFEFEMAYEVGETLWVGSANHFGMMVWPLPEDQMPTVWPIAPARSPPMLDMEGWKLTDMVSSGDDEDDNDDDID